MLKDFHCMSFYESHFNYALSESAVSVNLEHYAGLAGLQL